VIALHVIVERLTREPPNYSQIEDGLWLGGRVAQPPPGTDAVLNLCESEDPYRVEAHRWQSIRDGEPVPTLKWLREQVAFIEAERAAGRVVYVHCDNGVSRSGLVLLAYLMRREGWSRDQALAFVQRRRPGVRPNAAFMRLLLEWEHSLKD
jgi:protein-tyrosine phosphatase